MNLLNGIQQLNSKNTAGKPQPLQHWRNLAQKKIANILWPTRRQEMWKYTNLEYLSQTNWQVAGATDKAEVNSSQLASNIATPFFETFNFFNGVLQDTSGSKIPCRKLSELSEAELNQLLGEDISENIFETLNLAWSNQGLVIDLPAGKSFEKPICVDFHFSPGTEAVAAHPLLFIKVGAEAKATMIFRTSGEATYFNNLVAKVKLEKNSHVEFINLQSNSELSHSFSDVEFSLAESATLKTFNLSLNGKLNREKLDIFHQGTNSSSCCYGVYLTRKQNQSDHYTNIEHQVGHCQSVQLYKGLLADQSRAVFNGRVYIHPGAAKADSAQLNNNLLLSSQAEIDSKPQLEILNDDVKATHGSTVGQLDEEEIFYLQSRGIDRNQAIQLLAHGFAYEILNQLQSEPLREWLRAQLSDSLRGMDFI